MTAHARRSRPRSHRFSAAPLPQEGRAPSRCPSSRNECSSILTICSRPRSPVSTWCGAASGGCGLGLLVYAGLEPGTTDRCSSCHTRGTRGHELEARAAERRRHNRGVPAPDRCG